MRPGRGLLAGGPLHLHPGRDRLPSERKSRCTEVVRAGDGVRWMGNLHQGMVIGRQIHSRGGHLGLDDASDRATLRGYENVARV